MFFDAFGRFSFGQISQAATSTAVLVGSPGAYAITGSVVAFKSALAAGTGAYIVTGNAAAGASRLLASAGSYAISGGAAVFADTMPAAAGGYAITGQAVNFKSIFAVAPPGSYAITGSAEVFGGSLLAVAGSYAMSGGSSFLPGHHARRRALCRHTRPYELRTAAAANTTRSMAVSGTISRSSSGPGSWRRSPARRRRRSFTKSGRDCSRCRSHRSRRPSTCRRSPRSAWRSSRRKTSRPES